MPRPCNEVQRFFRDVPPGTLVEVSIDGPDGSCTLVWSLIAPGPDQTGTIICPDAAQAGPLSLPNATYVVVYDMDFHADAIVTIGLRVGSRSPVKCTVAGQQGDRFKWLWPILTD